MNILHLTMKYPPPMDGGLQRQVHGLAHSLANEHTVGIVTMGDDRMDGPVQVYGAGSVHDLLPSCEVPGLARANFALGAALARAMAHHRWDIVHAHDWMIAPAAHLARSGFGLPVVATFHADSGAEAVGSAEDRERRLEWERSLVASAAKVLACGRRLEASVRARHPASDVTYVPNGLWTEHFARSANSVDRLPLRLLFVGRLVPYKGCGDLIRAVALLKATWRDIELQVIGDGFARSDLEGLANELRVQDNVVFRGWLDGAELVRSYRAATIVVVPSHEEAFGLVVLEAMAAGASVIATTVGEFPAFIVPDQTGLLVPPGQSEVLARQIDRLLRDPKWRTTMAQTAKEQVVPEYDWGRVVTHTLHVYQDAIAR